MSQLESLFSLIESEFETSESLAQALESEKRCLETRDLTELQQLLCTKAELLSTIESLRERRTALLRQMGCAGDDQAIRTYLGTLEEAAAATGTKLLDGLEESVKKCKKYNELNGLLIANSQKRNQRRLDIMRGVSREQQLYDAQGKATSPSRGSSGKRA